MSQRELQKLYKFKRQLVGMLSYFDDLDVTRIHLTGALLSIEQQIGVIEHRIDVEETQLDASYRRQ